MQRHLQSHERRERNELAEEMLFKMEGNGDEECNFDGYDASMLRPGLICSMKVRLRWKGRRGLRRMSGQNVRRGVKGEINKVSLIAGNYCNDSLFIGKYSLKIHSAYLKE